MKFWKCLALPGIELRPIAVLTCLEGNTEITKYALISNQNPWQNHIVYTELYFYVRVKLGLTH